MIDPVGISASSPSRAEARHSALKKASQQLEGMFVQQLYKAMRDTVPQQEGIVSGGAGEEIFTGLLDQHLAAETPKHWQTGLSDALYRQLSRGLPTDPSLAASTPTFDTHAL